MQFSALLAFSFVTLLSVTFVYCQVRSTRAPAPAAGPQPHELAELQASLSGMKIEMKKVAPFRFVTGRLGEL